MKAWPYITLSVSALLIIVLLLVFTNPWSTLTGNSRQIALKSRGQVDRIVLADAYDSTVLIKQGDNWSLFGREPAGKVPVENLLIAAERLEIGSIVSKDSETGIGFARNISFCKGDKTILNYRLELSDKRYRVTLPGSAQSFFVAVSGYPGLDLEKVFSSASNHYREHLLIDLLPSEISVIEIELQNGTGFRFEQDMRGDITCAPANNLTHLPPGELVDLSARLLFSYFTSIVYEDKPGIMAQALMGSDSGVKRMARLHVESFKGENHTLQVFPYIENKGEKPHMFKALVLHNKDSEALVVNYIYLDVLMRNLTHYFGDK